jgi:hypothetical protein
VCKRCPWSGYRRIFAIPTARSAVQVLNGVSAVRRLIRRRLFAYHTTPVDHVGTLSVRTRRVHWPTHRGDGPTRGSTLFRRRRRRRTCPFTFSCSLQYRARCYNTINVIVDDVLTAVNCTHVSYHAYGTCMLFARENSSTYIFIIVIFFFFLPKAVAALTPGYSDGSIKAPRDWPARTNNYDGFRSLLLYTVFVHCNT